MRQCLYDASNARKRAVRDNFFESIGLVSLVSQYTAVSEENLIIRGVDLKNAKCKVMKKPDEALHVDYGWLSTYQM